MVAVHSNRHPNEDKVELRMVNKVTGLFLMNLFSFFQQLEDRVKEILENELGTLSSNFLTLLNGEDNA